jgi:hypothetical protein
VGRPVEDLVIVSHDSNPQPLSLKPCQKTLPARSPSAQLQQENRKVFAVQSGVKGTETESAVLQAEKTRDKAGARVRGSESDAPARGASRRRRFGVAAVAWAV